MAGELPRLLTMLSSIPKASASALATYSSAQPAAPGAAPRPVGASMEPPATALLSLVAPPAPASPLALPAAPGETGRVLARLEARLQAGASPDELRGLMRAAVPAIIRERTSIGADLARGNTTAARRRLAELDAALSALVPAAARLDAEGSRLLTAVARVLFGSEALVIANGPGRFSLWSERDREAPVLIASLPATTDLRAAFRAQGALAAPPAMGAHPADAAALSASPVLAHVASRSGSATRVADLYGRDLKLSAAPDPTALLNATHAANAATRNEGAELTMLSYNVALLQYKLFGFYEHKRSPLLEQRREPLARAIFGSGDDVIALQEVWRTEDVELFTRVAAEHGYRAFAAPRAHYNDGVITFVKESAIAPGTEVSHRARAYETQDWLEWWAAEITTLGMDVGVKRGFHEIAFTHPTAGRVALFNTHMQAFPDKWRERMQQARQLGLAAAAHGDDTAVLIAGDMNSGPYYRDDRRTRGKETTEGWWTNALAYPLLQHYSGARDLVVMGRPRAEADDDVELAGREADAAPNFPFTADHLSNSLYARQYGDGEYEARLDHIVGRAGDRLRVISSEMAYTGDVRLPSGETTELSDHYGVRVRMRLAPAATRGGATPTPAAPGTPAQ